MLSRLWGGFGVFEMFSYRGGVANRILIGWGVYESLQQNNGRRSIVLREIIVATLGEIIAVILDTPPQQFQRDLKKSD